MKDRISAILFIIVFLLVVAIVVMFLIGRDNNSQPPVIPSEATPDVATIPESSDPYPVVDGQPAVPVFTPNASLPTTAPTQAPASTTAPVSTPTPTAAPTPTPAPTTAPTQAPSFQSVSLGSGSFPSDTGTWLNIHADWSAKTVSTTQAEVTVTLYCDHYSLYTSKLFGAVNILLDGQYATMDSPAIEYDSNALKHTELATKTFTVDLEEGQSRTFGLHAEWGYGGEYGGPDGRVQLDSIECGGSITLSR